MKTFLDENFLLETNTAARLYHNFAAGMPIIDYHCHLSPQQIAENTQFENLTQVWLDGDHYKWRAMRANGIAERFITGEATDEAKFMAWAETVPYTMRNPLYHWTHLELQRYFGIAELLDAQSAKEIYRNTSAQLQLPENRVQGLLQKMNVKVVCTTDDPIDDLAFHQSIRAQNEHDQCDIQVLPAFRPDKAIAIEQGKLFNEYIDKLGACVGFRITTWEDLQTALSQRMDYFAEMGCKLSDYGLEQLYSMKFTLAEIEEIFCKARRGEKIYLIDSLKYKSALLLFLGQQYHQRGWTQQFHLGALRNNNTRLLKELGPDTGFDSMGDFDMAKCISHYLDCLDSTNQLTKTIVYNLNPRDNDLIATMLGNFNDGTVVGKMQYGAAWWFLDQKDGIEKQLNTLSNMGLLSRFVGMLTDSRSFLSFPRHEYFRRILCNLLGNDVEKGLLPNDEKWLGKLVQDICYRNAKDYFQFEEIRTPQPINQPITKAL